MDFICKKTLGNNITKKNIINRIEPDLEPENGIDKTPKIILIISITSFGFRQSIVRVLLY